MLVRKQDWTSLNQQLVTGAKLTVSLDSQFDLEELHLFQCNLNSPLKLVVQSERCILNQDNEEAVLHKDGRISQEIAVPVRCLSYGRIPCRKWGLTDTATWRTRCQNITDTNVELVTESRNVMEEADILLPNNVTRKTCCFNSHTLVSVYSNVTESAVDSKLLTNAFLSCKFSDLIHGMCNEKSGQLIQFRLCVYGNLVYMPYSQVSCHTGRIFEDTCNPKFNCHK